MTTSSPTLLLISAMYENGGNSTQRFLDGHPELVHYPFESQLGTRYVQDHLSSLYPAKYRWPAFLLGGSASDHYDAIIDEECRVRLKTPQASKFRDTPLRFDDGDRKARFVAYAGRGDGSRGALVEAYFRASADAWLDRARSEHERVFVGYSPIVGVDADKIIRDSPGFYLLNIVRHPFAAYADTKRRPVPLPLAHYATGWCVHQQYALASARRYPERVFILRYEDLIADPERALGSVLARIGVGPASSLRTPSWNGAPLEQIYPWGTIRQATPAAQGTAMTELGEEEKQALADMTAPLRAAFGYD